MTTCSRLLRAAGRHNSCIQRRPCFLAQLTSSSHAGNTAASSEQPASPHSGSASGHLSTHSQRQATDEAVEGVSARSNALDAEEDLSDDEFDDSAMERDSNGESSSLPDDNSMTAVLERLRGKLQHQDSTLSSSMADSDATGLGPYVYCKVAGLATWHACKHLGRSLIWAADAMQRICSCIRNAGHCRFSRR